MLGGFPRVSLAHLPTRLERLGSLSKHLGGPDIWIKRDDCTGLATGGNKTRKLEFLMADALRRGADTVVTIGAVQSNHVRQTAAAAARLGLGCHAVLETEVPCTEATYLASGNVLLDRLFGATLGYHEHGADMPAVAEAEAARLVREGRKPYLIPVGGSNALGALGYVDCATEIARQADEAGIAPDCLVHASGSAGTQAGLLAGFSALGQNLPVTGISVSSDEATQREKVRAVLDDTTELLGLDELPDSAVRVSDAHVGPGYGQPTAAMREAMALCARLEGLLLDPVYSGKAMAGLFAMIRSGELSARDTVVFLHTGGSAGLFAYDWYFNAD
jgi:L-cysteate sulfo-lyase